MASYFIENLAGTLYEKYCHAVGGKAFNGDPLPMWVDFRADPNKKVQSDAWIAVAELAADMLCLINPALMEEKE